MTAELITFRKPHDDAERDWAQDDDRWFNERDYPDDYVGSSSSDVLIAEVDGVRCVVKIEAPGFEDHLVGPVLEALLLSRQKQEA